MGVCMELNDLVGKTVLSFNVDIEELILNFENLEVRFYHDQDCCEAVYIEDIDGDLSDLVGFPLLICEESVDGGETEWGDSITWTFYRFATIKGYVTIRWYGSSNGYYSERVDIEFIKKEMKPNVSN